MNEERHSQFGIFSHPCFNRTFSNCLSHNSPAKGWPYIFRSRGTTGSSNWTMILAICVVVDESKCLDTPILEFSTICEHLPFLLCKLTLRLLLVHRNQAIWRWSPWFWRLSFEMMMILVQWILRKTPNRLSPCHFGEQLDLCIFGALPPIQRFPNDMCPSMMQNEPDVLASSITCFLLLSFVKFHAGIFSNFSPSLSTAAFAAGIFIAWGTGTNLSTKLQCWNVLSPFPATWSQWWFGNESHTHCCGFINFQKICKFCLDFVGCITPTILHNFIGHSRSNWRFQLLTRILDCLFKFRILKVDEMDPSQFSCVFPDGTCH